MKKLFMLLILKQVIFELLRHQGDAA